LTNRFFLQIVKRWEDFLFIFGNIVISIPNLFYVLRGFHTRYWADDYCFSGILRQYGFFRGLALFYFSISNRFSAFILNSGLELFGDFFIKLVIPISLLGFLIFLFLFIYKISTLIHIPLTISASFFLAQSLFFFMMFQAPNLDQSVYWRSGMVHYFFPLILFMIIWRHVFIGSRLVNNFWLTCFLFLLSFFSAGLSESYAALQAGVSLLTLPVLFVRRSIVNHHGITRTTAVITGTLCAMIMMVASPGNQMRLDSFQPAPDLLMLIRLSFAFGLDFIVLSIKGLWLPTLVSFSTAIFFGLLVPINRKYSIISILMIPVVTYLWVVCICAPTAYGMMAYPENRVLMLARFILVVGILIMGIAIGCVIKQRWQLSMKVKNLSSAFFLLLILYPLRSLPIQWNNFIHSGARASAWDSRHTWIREKILGGEQHLIVNALDSFSEIAEMRENPDFWVNECAAQFYGVKTIVAIEGWNE